MFDFLAHPFNKEGSALNWVLFVGLILCAVLFWQWILIKLARGVEAVAE
jgi:hypothetical protein